MYPFTLVFRVFDLSCSPFSLVFRIRNFWGFPFSIEFIIPIFRFRSVRVRNFFWNIVITFRFEIFRILNKFLILPIRRFRNRRIINFFLVSKCSNLLLNFLFLSLLRQRGHCMCYLGEESLCKHE